MKRLYQYPLCARGEGCTNRNHERQEAKSCCESKGRWFPCTVPSCLQPCCSEACLSGHLNQHYNARLDPTIKVCLHNIKQSKSMEYAPINYNMLVDEDQCSHVIKTTLGSMGSRAWCDWRKRIDGISYLSFM